MIGSRGDAVIYPEINEADYKLLVMYRTTPAIYDSMSEFEDDDAQEEQEKETYSPPTRPRSQPQVTNQCGTEARTHRIP